MVLIGGVGTSVVLLVVVYAAFQFRFRHLPDSLPPGKAYAFFLWLSSIVIVASGIYGTIMLFLSK